VAVAGRVVEAGPGDHAAVPVVGRRDVVHDRMRGGLALLDGLGVGAPVVQGRTGQGAAVFADQVRLAGRVHGSGQGRLPDPVGSGHAAVVVVAEDVEHEAAVVPRDV